MPVDTEDMDRERQVMRQRPWGLIIAASLLVLVGLLIIGGLAIQTYSADGNSYWSNMSSPQSQVMVALITVYAAALAATLGPLIYTMRIEDMRSSNAIVAKEMKAHVDQLISQIEHVRRSVKKMREDSLGQDAKLDEEDIRIEIEDIQYAAARLSEDIIFSSRKWKKKEQYSGLWPGRMTWIELLRDHRLIDDDQFELFKGIHESRRFTKNTNPDTPELPDLQKLRRELDGLKESLI